MFGWRINSPRLAGQAIASSLGRHIPLCVKLIRGHTAFLCSSFPLQDEAVSWCRYPTITFTLFQGHMKCLLFDRQPNSAVPNFPFEDWSKVPVVSHFMGLTKAPTKTRGLARSTPSWGNLILDNSHFLRGACAVWVFQSSRDVRGRRPRLHNWRRRQEQSAVSDRGHPRPLQGDRGQLCRREQTSVIPG